MGYRQGAYLMCWALKYHLPLITVALAGATSKWVQDRWSFDYSGPRFYRPSLGIRSCRLMGVPCRKFISSRASILVPFLFMASLKRSSQHPKWCWYITKWSYINWKNWIGQAKVQCKLFEPNEGSDSHGILSPAQNSVCVFCSVKLLSTWSPLLLICRMRGRWVWFFVCPLFLQEVLFMAWGLSV